MFYSINKLWLAGIIILIIAFIGLFVANIISSKKKRGEDDEDEQK